jgi:hypothetical protein
MTTKRLFDYLFATLGILALNSCEKDDKVQETPEVSTGVYVLNQGKQNSNNASLSYYDFQNKTATTDIFASQNKRGLGDIGQDIIKYGSKIYIALTGSSIVEVINAKTGVSIKSISMVDANGNATTPQTLTSANGKVFVVLYSGSVARLDTTSLSVDKTLAVGANPDKSIIVNNKLYVANTGGVATVKDSTVSVIQLPDFTETTRIKVNLNPAGGIGADSDGNVYIQSYGNYSNIPGKFQRIEAGTNKVTDINLSMQGFTIAGNYAYYFNYETDPVTWLAKDGSATVGVYDLKNQKTTNTNIINSSSVQKTPYGIGINPLNGDVYVGTTDYVNSGKAYCFGSDGTLKYSFSTGVNPYKFLFINNK